MQPAAAPPRQPSPHSHALPRRYGCAGPEVRRQYHMVGRRLQLDATQQHFRVVAQGGPKDGEEAVVGASYTVRLTRGEKHACMAECRGRC